MKIINTCSANRYHTEPHGKEIARKASRLVQELLSTEPHSHVIYSLQRPWAQMGSSKFRWAKVGPSLFFVAGGIGREVFEKRGHLYHKSCKRGLVGDDRLLKACQACKKVARKEAQSTIRQCGASSYLLAAKGPSGRNVKNLVIGARMNRPLW